MNVQELIIEHIVIGSGAAGFQAALKLHQAGETDLAVITENIKAGTSRNTGSDKQTYYKLSLAGADRDSVRTMAEDLFAGGCVDGDLAVRPRCPQDAFFAWLIWEFRFPVRNMGSSWAIRQITTEEEGLPLPDLILPGL